MMVKAINVCYLYFSWLGWLLEHVVVTTGSYHLRYTSNDGKLIIVFYLCSS